MKIGVIGSGTMGSGIVEVAAKFHDVVLKSRNLTDEKTARIKGKIEKAYSKAVSKGPIVTKLGILVITRLIGVL